MDEKDCPCEIKVLAWQNIKSGMTTYKAFRWQCTVCGAGSNMVSKESLTYKQKMEATQFDDGLREQWYAQKKAAREATWPARQEDRRRLYEQHVMAPSPKWLAIRDRIFSRSGGMCEGCGTRRASQVHHLTYQHLGDEFLWELVAVCRECHERVHDIDR